MRRFFSLIDSPLDNMRSRWMPASAGESDIGGHIDLFLFPIIRLRRETVFSPVSPHGQITLVNLSLEPHLDRLLSIEIHARNARTPEPLRRTVRDNGIVLSNLGTYSQLRLKLELN